MKRVWWCASLIQLTPETVLRRSSIYASTHVCVQHVNWTFDVQTADDFVQNVRDTEHLRATKQRENCEVTVFPKTSNIKELITWGLD